jgi:sugar/nucleoside kinase (ribokinase family)
MSTNSNQRKIHCLGAALADLIVTTIKDYPVPKVKTSIFVDTLMHSAGGGAVNSSKTLGKLGLDVSIYSKIGNDPLGKMIEESLNKNNVNTTNLVISQEENTSTVIVGVHENADRSFISYHGVLSSFSETDIDFQEIVECDYLIYSDLFNLPKIDGVVLKNIFNKAKENNVVTLLDSTWGISGLIPELLELLLPFTDYFLPSIDDCNVMFPGKSDKELIQIFIEMGASNVILKKGAEGVIGFKNGKYYESLPYDFNEDVVDTTGAGDNFNAGFIYGIANQFDFENSIKIGSFVAGYSLLGVGSWFSSKELLMALKKTMRSNLC